MFLFFVFGVFRAPGAVKQEKTSQDTETNSKINFIFGFPFWFFFLQKKTKNNKKTRRPQGQKVDF